MADDAKISVGIDGAEDAATKLGKMFEPSDAAAKKFQTSLSEVGNIGNRALGMVGTVASALTATLEKMVSVPLDEAAQKFAGFEKTVTRSSAMMGASSDVLKDRYKDLSRAVGIPDEALIKFSSSLMIATHDTGDNSKAIKALAAESLITGKSLEEMGALGADLHNTFGVGIEGIPEALEMIRGKAEALGTIGGTEALQDRMRALGGTIGSVAISSKKDLESLVDFMAVAGKNLRPEQQKTVQQRLLGFVATNTEPLRRQFHMKRDEFYDKDGGVKDPLGLLFKLQQDSIKRAGGRDKAFGLMAQENNLGPMAAAALFKITPEDVQKSRNAGKSMRATNSLKGVLGTPEERQESFERERAATARDTVGKFDRSMQRGGALAQLMPADFLANYEFAKKILPKDFIAGLVVESQLEDTGKAGERVRSREEINASEAQKRAAGHASLVAVERATSAGTATDEFGPVTARPEHAPHESAKADLAAAGTDLGDLSDLVASAVRDGFKGVTVNAQIDVVDSTGSPAGAISAYQSTQNRQ